jgi:hypothetical protein
MPKIVVSVKPTISITLTPFFDFAVENITDGLSGIANRTDPPGPSGVFRFCIELLALLKSAS